MTLEEMSAHALGRDPSDQAIEFKGRKITWGEMRHLAERVSDLVAASGADPRAPVALVARTRPSCGAALLGLIAAGRTVRMIYAYQSPVSIAGTVDRLKPAVVVAASQDLPEDLLARLRESGVAVIALTEMDAVAIPGFEHSTAAADLSAPPRHLETLTSGTTGPPKQFPISFDIIADHIVGDSLMFSKDGVAASPQIPFLHYAPLGNIAGIYGFLPSMLRGRPIVLLERFTVADWRQYILRFRPEHASLPAAGVQMVVDANIPPEDLAGIKTISTGAAPVDPNAQQAFEERYGALVLTSYGATEFAGPVTAMTADLRAEWGNKKWGSVGLPVHGAELRVIDPDTKEILPQGREGILEVMLPPMGTHWIRTSDLALIDEDGFMFHRGRADGAINRGGFKLVPETIERALLLHPAVSAAVVVDIPDKRLGQVPAAAIQFKPDADQPSEAEIEAHLRDHVLATHIPVAWRFVEAIPRTPSVKVDRPAVRKLFDREQHENS